MPRQYIRIPLATRFYKYVPEADLESCWPWLGSRDRKSYGKLNGSSSPLLAHRIAWELAYGPVPDGLFVLHKCDNPPCVNPTHLFLGTNADNVADMIAKGRARHRTPLGSAHWNARLTEAEIPEIRKRLAAGESQRIVARTFGVTKRTIQLIGRHEAWQHVS